MQAFAVAGRAGAAAGDRGAANERPARICGNVNPIADNPPACKNVRRAIGVEAFHRDRIIIYRYREVPEFIKALQAGAMVQDSFRPPRFHATIFVNVGYATVPYSPESTSRG
jgi:hypothetical protein